MKVSLNWLKKYIKLDQKPAEIADILTSLGLEVEGMEEIETVKGGLEGVVVGHVLECGKHPNADKLSLCRVDLGNEEPVSIVCGAPNVAKGQKVLVATVGTTLYTPEGESWTIKKGNIRGEVSEGMICAEDELGLGDDHSGIIVLPENSKVGMPAKELYEIENDVVFEIGLTPNRSDATSHIGIAEDLAAYLKINVDPGIKLSYPDIESFNEGVGNGGFKVQVLDPEGAPRYSGILLERVKVKESPDWLKNTLRSIGLNPKNNIVDITNYILHEYGQPLHAFDADKITGKHIKVQTLNEGELFIDLEGKERQLSSEDVMICDGEDKGMCIGGVYGGLNTGVTENTTNVFLESAHFNPTRIRRTSTRHLLRTDAAVCFEKGSDPNITITALKRASMLMQELAEAVPGSAIFDLYPRPVEPRKIMVKFSHIYRLIGERIPEAEIKQILKALHMEIVSENDDTMLLAVPTNKTDVTREADVIEEILRIYGFNKVGIPEKVTSTISYKPHPDKQGIKNKVAEVLCGMGFSEMMAVSLNPESYYEEMTRKELVYINNTSNIHLNAMRADMLHSMLEAMEYNINRQETDLKLFEFGRTYRKKNEVDIIESEKLSIGFTGDIAQESWLNVRPSAVDNVEFYYIKAAVHQILDRLGIQGFQVSETENETFIYGLKYHRGTKILADFGLLKPGVCLKMGVKNKVAFAELDWEELVNAAGKNKIEISDISKYPKIRRDLALVLDDEVNFAEIEAIARKADKKILKQINLFDVYKNENHLGKGKKSYAVSFEFQDDQKTLKDKEVDKLMRILTERYEKIIGAFIRK